MRPDPKFDIHEPEALNALFDAVNERSIVKEIDHVDANYRALVEASPFCVLATAGPDGLDCSPRGDKPGFVAVLDPKTLAIPDRRGNNRLDSIRNVLVDPRVALLFFVPGLGETLRINGRATISTDPSLVARFTLDGKSPKIVLVVAVDTVFFQCSRAVVRADLWNPAAHVDRARVPTAGKILGDLTAQKIDAAAYDAELPARVASTLY